MKMIRRLLVFLLGFGLLGGIGVYLFMPPKIRDHSQQSIKYAFQRLVMRATYLVAESEQGVKFKFKTEDAIGRKIYKYRSYEPEVTQAILDHISFEEGDVIIDVGANIGWYALTLNRITPANTKIYAFEPNIENYELMQHNIQLNQANNIVSFPTGLSDVHGFQTLYLYLDKNMGKHSMLPIHDGDTTTVDTTTLDRFINENSISPSTIKLLKIDVEGFEGHVLKGGKNALKSVQNVLHDFSPDLMQYDVMDSGEIPKLLLESGFKPYLIAQSGVVEINQESFVNRLSDGANILWKRVSS